MRNTEDGRMRSGLNAESKMQDGEWAMWNMKKMIAAATSRGFFFFSFRIPISAFVSCFTPSCGFDGRDENG
jgi:hypothetical protein